MGANVILLAVMAVSMFASGHAFCLASPLRHPSLPSTGHRRRLVSYEGSSVVRRVFDVADQEGPKRTSKTTLDRIDKMVGSQQGESCNSSCRWDSISLFLVYLSGSVVDLV